MVMLLDTFSSTTIVVLSNPFLIYLKENFMKLDVTPLSVGKLARGQLSFWPTCFLIFGKKLGFRKLRIISSHQAFTVELITRDLCPFEINFIENQFRTT